MATPTRKPPTRKHLTRLYLDYIVSGEKIVEGRVRDGFWAKVRVGDRIIFFDSDEECLVEVVGLSYAPDFQTLYDMFGHELLPNVYNREDAAIIYSKWFKKKDIQDNGVVGVEIRVV